MNEYTRLAVKVKWMKDVLSNNWDKGVCLMKLQVGEKGSFEKVGAILKEVSDEILADHIDTDNVIVFDQGFPLLSDGLHLMIKELTNKINDVNKLIKDGGEVALVLYMPLFHELMRSDHPELFDICWKVMSIIKKNNKNLKLIVVDEDKYKRISPVGKWMNEIFFEIGGKHEYYVLPTESVDRHFQSYVDDKDIERLKENLGIWLILSSWQEEANIFKSDDHPYQKPGGEKAVISHDSEYLNIVDVYDHLSNKIVAQDIAVQKISEVISNNSTVWRKEFSNTNVHSILFFAGPTGTGKTQMAKEIAEYVFEDKDNVIKFDMSNFTHQGDISTILGSPPGYAHADTVQPWIEKIQEDPRQVIIFDEIEKSYVGIIDVLLGVLDTGILNTSNGREVDLSQSIIIMTSNLGRNSFSPIETIREVEQYFAEINRPEVLGRIGRDNVVPFQAFDTFKAKKELFDYKLSLFEDKLFKHLNINLIYPKSELLQISKSIISKVNWKYGARDLQGLMNRDLFDDILNFVQHNNVHYHKAKSSGKHKSIKISFAKNKMIVKSSMYN